MKKVLIIVLAIVLGLAVRPVEVSAGDEGWAVVAGFIGGAIVGSALSDSCAYSGGVVIDPGYAYERPYVQHGRYEYRRKRVWVSGCWIYQPRRCGRAVRVWQPGYYTWQNVQVWVPGRGSYRTYARRRR
ncbi:MAG: hypothetical protein KJ626_12490 [Verrucomicrobia bacterium]|nr:hypothetical protein [Verrucomicrobiota bacterium]